jgi:hypothetical protein
MDHPARDRKFDAERSARSMERALFDSKPVLRSVWPVLSEQVRFDSFALHRPDLTRAYRVAIEASRIMRPSYPGPRRVTRTHSK